MTEIGCFVINELSPGRWKVVNTLTQVEHVTYGTLDELESLLQQQTRAWQARLKVGPVTGKVDTGVSWAWRKTMVPKK